MFSIAVVLSLLVMVVVLSPFFMGNKEPLAPAAAISDAKKLEDLKKAVLQRYLQEKRDFEQGRLSERLWKKRQHYLIDRYIDLVRRLDVIKNIEKIEQGASS